MRGLLEEIKLSKISYLVEKLEKRTLKEKIKSFKKIEKQKITKKIGLFLIENSTRNFEVADEFGGINSSLIELCFKNYYDEYNDAISAVFKDLPVKAQDRVLYLLTTRNDEKSLQLYTDLVLKYYKKRENIPIGELISKPLAYPYLFPKLYKALKFDIEKNNIIILLNQYLSSGVVLKDDIKKNKKLITDNICNLFDKALKFKFKNTYDGLNNKEYKELRYFLELSINIEYYISSKKTKDYLNKLFKKNDNQLKLFILDNYIRKNEKLTKINFNPIIKDKASRYALLELLNVYNKTNLLNKYKITQKDLAQSDLYTNFVIATAYTGEPQNIRFVKTYTKDNYDYYIFKFDYKYKYNNSSNDFLTNYICNQLGINKHNGEEVTNKFIGISGGFEVGKEMSIVSKKYDKLLFSKIENDDDIDQLVGKILNEYEIEKDAKMLSNNSDNKVNNEKPKNERKLLSKIFNISNKQKKEYKKLKKEINNSVSIEEKEKRNYHIFTYILLFLFTVFVGLLIYCMLYIYGVGSINDGIDEIIIKPTKLDDKGNFTEILGTEIFNQTENEYFVLLFKGAKKEKTKYYRYINEYNKRNFRFYYVDLKNKENRFLYLPNDLDFTLHTDRFLKVKDKEYEYYVDGKTNILNEMQLQIEQIIEKEKEEKKQALLQRKKEKLESIAISMADNKKDKRPVTRILFKAAKKQKEVEKYALNISEKINTEKIQQIIEKNSNEIINTQVLAKNSKRKIKKTNIKQNYITYKLEINNDIKFSVIKPNQNIKYEIVKKKNNDKKNIEILPKTVAYQLKSNYNINNQIITSISNKTAKSLKPKIKKNHNHKYSNSIVIYQLKSSSELTLK